MEKKNHHGIKRIIIELKRIIKDRIKRIMIEKEKDSKTNNTTCVAQLVRARVS